MATQADDILDLDEEDEIEGAEEVVDPPEGEDEEEIATFGEEDESAPPPVETDLVKHLRQQIRERDKRLSQVTKPDAEQPIVVGDRPTMEGCEYDQERFDAELDAWDERRDAKRAQDQRIEQRQRQQGDAWQQVQANYQTKKAALRFPDKDTAEAAAFDVLSPVQQAVIAKVAPDPALFIYAAGKNQARLNELAGIEDPLVLAATIGRMGAALTVKKRARAPEPEQVVRGGTVKTSAVAKQLEKLEAQADKSGDRSAVIRFKRENNLI